MKNLSKNHPVLSKLTISKILPVFLLASISLSSLQINSMDRSSCAGIATNAVGLAIVCLTKYLNSSFRPRYIQDTTNQKLISACITNEIDQVRHLLANNADVNAKDDYGYTALMRAAKGDHTEICELLITAGADVNVKIDGDTMLLWATNKGYTEICRLLIIAGADVNAKSKYNVTALASTACYGRTEICRLLITAGADLNSTGCPSHKLLTWAADRGHIEICTQLIAAGAEIPAGLREYAIILAIPEELRNQSPLALKSPLIRTLTSRYPKQAGHLITLANINELLRTHDINSYIGDPAKRLFMPGLYHQMLLSY